MCLSALLFNRIVDNDGSYTYDNVQNWYTRGRDANPLLRHFIHLPTNLSGLHWTGITIDTKRHHIIYVDPIGGRGRHELYYIKRWIRDEIDTQLANGGLTAARHTSSETLIYGPSTVALILIHNSIMATFVIFFT